MTNTSGTKRKSFFCRHLSHGKTAGWKRWTGSTGLNWAEALTGQEWPGKRSVTSQVLKFLGSTQNWSNASVTCMWRMWFTAWCRGTRMVCIGLKDGCNACRVNWHICFLLSFCAFSHLARGCLWWKTQWYIVPCQSFKSPVSAECGRTIQKPPLSQSLTAYCVTCWAAQLRFRLTWSFERIAWFIRFVGSLYMTTDTSKPVSRARAR